FLVYLIPLLPLAMTFFLKRIPKADLNDSATSDATQQQKPTTTAATTAVTAPQGVKTHDGLIMSRMWACIGLYFFVTFCVIILSYYAPYVAEKEHLSSEFTGTITSVFFLFVFLPGFFLSKIIDVLKNSTMIVCIALIFIGLAIFAAWPTATGMMIGAVLMGLGYGTSQPMIYDKATFTTTDPRKATLVLSFILAGNYLAIVVAPVVIDFVRGLFHAENVRAFSFIFNCALSGLFLILAIIKRKSFIFRS
ncbi:MAG: MFS transporter, partial [Muribaculaceae bacterium]|nr:MFS transporter [Muribaculaceae bacterium]